MKVIDVLKEERAMLKTLEKAIIVEIERLGNMTQDFDKKESQARTIGTLIGALNQASYLPSFRSPSQDINLTNYGAM